MQDKIDFTDCKILIVDDNNQNLSLLGTHLKKFNLKLAVATNGQTAYDTAVKFLPDLILMDVNMPILDGFESTKLIKNNPITTNIPIIFLTALTDLDSIIKGYEFGGVDYVVKPFNFDELYQRVKAHLQIKKLMEKVELQRNELEIVNKTKDKFFSIISHDLREPFISAMSITDMVIKFNDRFTKEQLFEKIVKLNVSLKNQYSLLDKLLDWSRVQTDGIEYRPTKISVGKILSHINNTFQDYFVNKNISFEVNTYQIDLNDKFLLLDEFMINSIFSNIVSNAIKFSHKDGKIRLDVIENEKECLFIIKDNGVGMNETVLNNLFKIDVHNSTLGTDKEIGTGLGLILVKEFLDKNNGEITVESEIGKGTSIKIKFFKRV